MAKVVFKDKQVLIGGVIYSANKEFEVKDELVPFLSQMGAIVIESKTSTKADVELKEKHNEKPLEEVSTTQNRASKKTKRPNVKK